MCVLVATLFRVAPPHSPPIAVFCCLLGTWPPSQLPFVSSFRDSSFPPVSAGPYRTEPSDLHPAVPLFAFLFLPCGSSQSTYPASPWPPRVPGSQIPGNSRQAPVELRDHQQLLTAPHWSWSFCRRATRRICRRLHLLHLQSRYVFSLC